jgi:hypothetical protein
MQQQQLVLMVVAVTLVMQQCKTGAHANSWVVPHTHQCQLQRHQNTKRLWTLQLAWQHMLLLLLLVKLQLIMLQRWAALSQCRRMQHLLLLLLMMITVIIQIQQQQTLKHRSCKVLQLVNQHQQQQRPSRLLPARL